MAPGTLPHTGSNAGDMAAAGVTLLALGAVAIKTRKVLAA